MLSLSFVTIIPLLKVMIGNEGLHGWVDRKAVRILLRAGRSIPPRHRMMRRASLSTYLQVARVAKGSLAEQAGLRPGDRITDVNKLRAREPNAPYARLLQELAAVQQNAVRMELKRSQKNAFQSLSTEMKTPCDPACIETLGWTWFKQAQWHAGVTGVHGMQWFAAFLPREQSVENTVKAVFLIVLVTGVTTVIRCIAKYFQDYLGQKIVEVSANRLREDVFAHLTRMPMSIFADEKPSDFISRIVRDTVTMGGALRVLLGKALREPMNALFMLGMALYINWHLTLVFLCGGPLVVVLFGTFGRKMKKATRRSLGRRLGHAGQAAGGGGRAAGHQGIQPGAIRAEKIQRNQ